MFLFLFLFSLPISSFIRISIYVLSLVTFSSAAVRIGSDETYFTHPASSDSDTEDEGLSYALGSVQEISWVTGLDVFNISIWQRSGGSGDGGSNGRVIFAKTEESDSITTFFWAVQTYGLDLDTSSTFYLTIGGDTGKDYTSADFNITSSSSTSSSNSISPSTSPSPPTNTDDSTPASTGAETASSLTSTGKIALGLGAGIGAPLISLLAILAYFQYRSIRRNAHQDPDPYTHPLHTHHSHQPSMSGGGGGGGYYSSMVPSPTEQQQQQHLQIPIPPSILPPSQIPVSGPLYRTANLVPSELPQKLARPVNLPPWEVHSDPAEAPAPAPRDRGLEGLGVGLLPGDAERVRNGTGRSRAETTNSTIGRAITTPTGYGPGPGTRSESLWEHRASGPRIPRIPELHGESANYI